MAEAKTTKEKLEIKVVKGNAELRFKALKGKDGRYVTYGFHSVRGKDGKKAPGQGRGATAYHADFAAATAAVNAAIGQATKAGWTKPVRAASVRSDAWDLKTIPA